MSIPRTRICTTYAVAVAWHAYLCRKGYPARLQRWGTRWQVPIV